MSDPAAALAGSVTCVGPHLTGAEKGFARSGMMVPPSRKTFPPQGGVSRSVYQFFARHLPLRHPSVSGACPRPVHAPAATPKLAFPQRDRAPHFAKEIFQRGWRKMTKSALSTRNRLFPLFRHLISNELENDPLAKQNSQIGRNGRWISLTSEKRHIKRPRTISRFLLAALMWPIFSGALLWTFVTDGMTFPVLRKRALINDAARAADQSADFSKLIREGRPGFGK